MSDRIGSADVERFRVLLGLLLGLQFEDSKLSQLAEVLASRLLETSLPCESYLSRLSASSRPELRALARELTVGETYFFRNPDQFRAFSEAALPDCTRRGRRPARILSAGCASGEEPYSLAILLAGRLEPSGGASIRAVDVNAAALAKAAQGRYTPWALRETPEDVQGRWFRQQGRDFILDEGPRRFVTFEERNLASADPELWQPEAYDIVFCRNVLMYFTARDARALVERIERSMTPTGYLFLGHAETLRGLSQGFHLRHTHGTFYYQRRDPTEPHATVPVGYPRQASVDPGPVVAAVEGAVTWVEAIQRASDRIHALAQGSEHSAAVSAAAPAAPGRGRWELGSTLELLKAERFGEALEMVRRLPSDAAADPEVLLLQATLFTHNGQFDEAERACERLLAADELNAGAHYLLALCREGRSDSEGARHHDQLAAYLDPSFAMPRLHLGLLGRRGGDKDGARRELEHALLLLQHEDASRLLLFGGGFGREALVALCGAELARCQDAR